MPNSSVGFMLGGAGISCAIAGTVAYYLTIGDANILVDEYSTRYCIVIPRKVEKDNAWINAIRAGLLTAVGWTLYWGCYGSQK